MLPIGICVFVLLLLVGSYAAYSADEPPKSVEIEGAQATEAQPAEVAEPGDVDAGRGNAPVADESSPIKSGQELTTRQKRIFVLGLAAKEMN